MQQDIVDTYESRLQKEQDEKDASFQAIQDMVYGHVRANNRWPNVYFTESGMARLGAIAGWLMGLAHGEKKELAINLAHDLDKRIKYASATRMVDVTPADSEDTKELPTRKIVLADDGTFNGFSVLFYALVHPDAYKKVYDAEFEKVKKGEEDDHWYKSKMATMGTRRHFKIPEDDLTYSGRDMKETRYYYPKWDKERISGLSSVVGHYAYHYNGGLLYHGPGRSNNLFAVTLGEVRGWSLHT